MSIFDTIINDVKNLFNGGQSQQPQHQYNPQQEAQGMYSPSIPNQKEYYPNPGSNTASGNQIPNPYNQQAPQQPIQQYNQAAPKQPVQQYNQPQQPQQKQTTQSTFDTTPYRGNSTETVPQPPKQIADLFNQYFNGDQARALITTYFENRGFKSDAMNYNFNDHTSSTDPRLAAQHGGIASTDYGLMQINDKGAFKDLQNMAPNFLKAHGINSPRDLLDPEKNVAAAYAYTTLLRNQGVSNPWIRWYGWQDNGYNLNQSPQGNIAMGGGQ